MRKDGKTDAKYYPRDVRITLVNSWQISSYAKFVAR